MAKISKKNAGFIVAALGVFIGIMSSTLPTLGVSMTISTIVMIVGAILLFGGMIWQGLQD